MTTEGVRRSGRIAKKIPIVLEGTDTSGRYFREETHTVLLSRHGAGVISINKPGPDEPLTLRIAETKKEAQVRLVGRMGGDTSLFIYGLAFLDPDLDFWGIAFPPGERYTIQLEDGQPILLECCLCQSRQEMSDSEIDADVYAVNQNILMHCETCGTASIWKRAQPGASRSRRPGLHSSTLPPAELPAYVSRLTTAPLAGSFAKRPHIGAADPVATQAARLLVPAAAPPANHQSYQHVASATLEPPAAASASPQAPPAPHTSSTIGVLSFVKTMPPANGTSPNGSSTKEGSSASATPASQAKPKGFTSLSEESAPPPRLNRRKDVRTGVTFTACIRHSSAGDEVVECDNISRGGFSFRSRSCYAEGSLIEAAVPYSPGGHAIFVLAVVRRVEVLPGGNLYRHGAAYQTATTTNTFTP